MRQIVYLSKAAIAGDEADLATIFDQSRHNNAIDGVTGLLWFEGGWFLQAFEGPAESVAPTFARIRADARHTNITILVDRPISQREFGTWTMGHFRPGEEADDDAKMKRLLSNATDEVSGLFLKMLERST